jgi:hypothetical protein
MSNLQILVGADPEIFMRKDGMFVSAHGAIPGDKKNPHKVDKGAVQVDGMALEFNIDPAASEEEFVGNVQAVMATLHKMVPGFELVADPVAHFGAAYIAAQPAEAVELGCDPDFNAWMNGAANERPDGAADFRTGAGHVHIGWTKDADCQDPGHVEACVMLAQQMDYYLGLGSLWYDGDQKRRELYGAPGAFRIKPYGMEYRVLSNAWLRSEKLMRWVYSNAVKGTRALLEGESSFEMYGDAARDIISRGNKFLASRYMRALQIQMPEGV